MRNRSLFYFICIVLLCSVATAQNQPASNPFDGPNQAVQNLFATSGYNQPLVNQSRNQGNFTANPAFAYGNAPVTFVNGQPVVAVRSSRGVVFVPVGNLQQSNISQPRYRSGATYRRYRSQLGQGLHFGN